MGKYEIPVGSWPEFLDGFSREHEGTPVTMVVMAPDRGQQVEARDLPLGGVTADLRQPPGAIVVVVGRRPGAHLTHHITAPTSVTVEETEEGAHQALRIVSNAGEETVVRFRVAVESEERDIFFQ